MDLANLYQTQISFTEWFERINHPNKELMRTEDNEKRERLKVLQDIIGLPYDKPCQFSAKEIALKSPSFTQFFEEHQHEACALRLIPLDPSLPKLRMRGKKIKNALLWFHEQTININQYRADFVPHTDENEWSTIFVINARGIFGEIIRGGHHQLTQGFYEEHKPIQFSYNFKEWFLSEENKWALTHLQEIIHSLHTNDSNQQKLHKSLQSTFSNNYLEGYFETVASKEFGVWFVDYNRILGKMFEDMTLQKKNITAELSGMPAFKGKVRGRVHIINSQNQKHFQQNDILVCEMTTPDLLPLMQKAGAIITDKGGILSHAAIVSRELKIPCITATGKATSVLKDGEMVEVDAEKGVVKKIL